MSRVLVKLFRDHAKAEQAIRKLKSRGYTGAEIGVLVRDRAAWIEPIIRANGIPVAEVELPGVGPAVALGPTALVLGEAGDAVTAEGALRQGLGISHELYSLYEFGLFLGGVILSVHTGPDRIADARQILREAKEAEATQREAVAVR